MHKMKYLRLPIVYGKKSSQQQPLFSFYIHLYRKYLQPANYYVYVVILCPAWSILPHERNIYEDSKYLLIYVYILS